MGIYLMTRHYDYNIYVRFGRAWLYQRKQHQLKMSVSAWPKNTLRLPTPKSDSVNEIHTPSQRIILLLDENSGLILNTLHIAISVEAADFWKLFIVKVDILSKKIKTLYIYKILLPCTFEKCGRSWWFALACTACPPENQLYLEVLKVLYIHHLYNFDWQHFGKQSANDFNFLG
jgi:hypothetical protein